jgi:hypothetical protein
MTLEDRFGQHLARASAPPVECDILTEPTLWSQHGPAIWKPKRVDLEPSFYPAYRWGDLYSYSLIALLLRKGHLDVNPEPIQAARSADFQYWSGNQTLDRDIVRIGGPDQSTLLIKSPEELATRLAQALRDDAAATERLHPAHTNIVLCGGKDSLNLLLIPWRNPTLAFSAAPNFPLVQEFVARNNLPIEVQRLEDPEDPAVQEEEALLGLCRMDLRHWRWGTHLQQLARSRGPNVIFWKGQVADLYTAPKWKVYMAPPSKLAMFPRKVYKRLGKYLPTALNVGLGRRLQPGVVRAAWLRSAALQGQHMEFLRELTGCLFLSAYHGPSVRQVWRDVDLASAVQADMRHLVGQNLAGRPVVYPSANPAPPPSPFRAGLGSPKRFFDLLDRLKFPHSPVPPA